MKVSTKLAWQVQERIALWQPEFKMGNTNQALYLFKGEVYHGLDAASFPLEVVEYTQQHLRILSGLYGVIRPLDRIQPHRLEMETSLRFGKYENLYHFWRDKITRHIGTDLKESGSSLLINLASLEYSAAIDLKKLKAKIVAPQFLESRNDSLGWCGGILRRCVRRWPMLAVLWGLLRQACRFWMIRPIRRIGPIGPI